MNLVALAQHPQEIRLCYPVMAQLRPQYTLDQFVDQVMEQMKQGYHLAYLVEEDIIKSVAGFRISTCLAWGKYLYVDDLVSAEKYRHLGTGTVIFEWLVDYAKFSQCRQLHLDSGVRHYGAHRFYIKRGLDITGHHFTLILE
jgi:GNAT superfamily N-acetyltransferase